MAEKKESSKIKLSTGGVVSIERSKPRAGEVMGDMKIEDIHWDHLFDDELNYMFSAYKSAHGQNMFSVDEEGNIGMWITIRDTVTEEEYTGYMFKECCGTLMVIIYILLQCMEFRNADGHLCNFMTDEGVAVFYDRFCQLVPEETDAQMRRFFTYTGGYVEALIKNIGFTTKNVFDVIDENIN